MSEDHDDIETMACAVCAETLFPGRSGGEVVVWLHRADLVTVWPENADLTPDEVEAKRALLGIEGADHIAVPVPVGDVRAETRCDFCSQPNPGWVLPVEQFEASPTHGFTSNWALCDVCARAIKKNQWDKVLRRALDTAAVKYKVNANAPELVDAIRALHAQVREYQQGPPVRK